MKATFAALAAATLVLVFAGSARAATFCVNVDPCLLGTPFPTIQEALDEAALQSPGTDTVRIGPGVYANSGTPSYTDTEIVHIIGAGPGETVIENDGSSSSTFTLRQNSASSIEGMTIEIPDVSNGVGLWWDAAATNVEGVHEGPAGTSITGFRAEGNATLTDSVVTAGGAKALSLIDATNVSVTDSVLSGGASGISASGGGTLTLSRSTVSAPLTGVQVGGTGATLNVTNSVIRRTSTAAPSTNSALSVLPGASAVVRHATIVGNGAGRGATVSGSGFPASLLIFDSIIHNFETTALCAGEPANPATFAIQYSNFTDPLSVNDPNCTENIGVGNDTTSEPDFVGADSLVPNFRLDAPSPLIDAADPADPIAEDFAADPRPIDGDGAGGARSDMGAYEYQRQAPTASINVPATATVGVPASFSAAGSSDPDPGDGVTSTWDFGDGATATGFTPTHTFTSPGTRTVTLTVTDPTGLTDTDSAQLVVAPGPAAADPPNTTITTAPTKKQLRKRKAKFAFTASQSAATFECKLDDNPFAACTSPVTFKKLKLGRHEFAVRAVNAAGPDPTPATKRFKVKRRR